MVKVGGPTLVEGSAVSVLHEKLTLRARGLEGLGEVSKDHWRFRGFLACCDVVRHGGVCVGGQGSLHGAFL